MTAMNWEDNMSVLMLYPMTSVEISGCWEMCNAQWPPLRNRIIPNLTTAGAWWTTRPVASCFLGRNGCLVGNYVISQRVWVLAIWTDNVWQMKDPCLPTSLRTSSLSLSHLTMNNIYKIRLILSIFDRYMELNCHNFIYVLLHKYDYSYRKSFCVSPQMIYGSS